MKKFKYLLCLFLLSIYSCEEVIDVNLETSTPKLVIDASLQWVKNTDGKTQQIELSLTAPYFNETVPAATGATVTVTDLNNNTFNFIEENGTGIYKTDNFIPVLNATYNLNISYDNELYTASTTLVPVAPIENIEQVNDGGFSGDEIELKTFYTDPSDAENFYLFEFLLPKTGKIALEVYDDEFSNGNKIFAFFTDDELESGDKVIIKSSGITKRTFQFLSILLLQTSDDGGGPFETQPATLRGNCINQTNPENFPLGYFKVSETDVVNYLVE